MFMMPMILIGPILWIAVIGLIVWVVVIAYGRKGKFWQSGDSALETLKKSYARGEINKDEFDTKKKDLA